MILQTSRASNASGGMIVADYEAFYHVSWVNTDFEATVQLGPHIDVASYVISIVDSQGNESGALVVNVP